MTAWIYVITDSQRDNHVRISYMEQEPNQWLMQQNSSMQLQYAAQGANPHRAKLQIYQHLQSCKCLPNDKADDWFECALPDALTVVQWALGVPRTSEQFANQALEWQQQQMLQQQQRQKKEKIILSIKWFVIVLLMSVALFALRWWWTHE